MRGDLDHERKELHPYGSGTYRIVIEAFYLDSIDDWACSAAKQNIDLPL